MVIASSADAAHYLKQNQSNLQSSLKRLASGKRLTGGADDPGGLAVSMKLNASVKRLAGAQNNVQNALSFMEVQDGLLETAGNIITRISELKGLHSDDPLKSTSNQAAYNTELTDLSNQLDDIAATTFNGEAIFNAAILGINYDEDVDADLSLAVTDFATAIANVGGGLTDLGALAVTDIDAALEAVAGLRSQNGSGQNRLNFASQSLSLQRINMVAALSRIEDVDLAAETAELAKHSILTRASASMVAQANSQNDIALMLLS